MFSNQEMKPKRTVIIGLDGAGKTSILFHLKFDDYAKSKPTIGINISDVTVKGIPFTIWDLGGSRMIRQLWCHHYVNLQALIYVIDSTDLKRVGDVKQSLSGVINRTTSTSAPILIYANKQDQKGARSIQDIIAKIDLGGIARHREWCIVGSSAITGEGLNEGLEWLSKAISKNTQKMQNSSASLNTQSANLKQSGSCTSLDTDESYLASLDGLSYDRSLYTQDSDFTIPGDQELWQVTTAEYESDDADEISHCTSQSVPWSQESRPVSACIKDDYHETSRKVQESRPMSAYMKNDYHETSRKVPESYQSSLSSNECSVSNDQKRGPQRKKKARKYAVTALKAIAFAVADYR